MTTHSSILAWRIPWTKEPGGLYSPYGCKELDMTEVTQHACMHSPFPLVFTVFLPRSKCPLISWLLSPSTVILEPKKIKSVTASTFSLSICHEVMGPDAMVLGFVLFCCFFFLMLSFSPAFLLLFHLHQESLYFLFIFCYQSVTLCISEVVDISPSNLDSSL